VSFDEKFYDDWARTHLSEPNREQVMKTTARILHELWKKQNPFKNGDYSCAEIGGAEGTLLNEFTALAKVKRKPTNFELSKNFIVVGRKKHPKINFVQGDFSKYNGPKMDLIILSDIVEHIPEDAQFLNSVAKKAGYVLLKIPIEKLPYSFLLNILGKSKPVGKNHPSGHLHAYTINSAKRLCEQDFEILAMRQINFFEAGNPPKTIASKILNTVVKLLKIFKLDVTIFGGALAMVLKSKIKMKNDIKNDVLRGLKPAVSL